MATIGRVSGCLVSLMVIVFLNYGLSQDPSTNGLKSEDAKAGAESLSQKLVNFFESSTQYKAMKNFYQGSARMRYEAVDGMKLVKEMADNLGKFLGKKVEGLQFAVKEAEEIAKEYRWNENLKNAVHVSGEDGFDDSDDKIGTVEYVNSKLLKRDDPMLEYNPTFNQAVNLSVSSVHIPVEIYEGNIEILNGLNWTSELDQVFQRNRERDPDLLWQFFGSQTGFMRTMPASRWRCFGEVDLYDVRRRPWYTQGSSSPKDMLILIDTSGSVHGQALQLIKVAVQSLLDTLGDNDFFNIIWFSSKVGFVHECFNHTFVQANYRNKRILQNRVADLNATGKADFRKGLTFAFEQFEKFRENDTMHHGAKCNEVIMLLTDGGSDKAKEVFEKYNWPNNKSATVRVFTIAVGPIANPVSGVRWMACHNRGFFSPIPAMGAIRSKVQEYIPVLSRPMGLNNAKHISWGNIRYDNTGLGMMTTVTLPVYNRSLHASNQTILGVMGVDVTTKRLMEATPMEKLTPNGYSFAINQNGYIIFHPDLKAQNGWLQDPPNVDFLDLEYETELKEEVRMRMIDREDGDELITTFSVQSDDKHIIEVNRTYFFTSIDNCDFSLALVTPEYAQVYPVINNKYTDDEGFAIFEDIKDSSLIPIRNYYENLTMSNASGTIQELIDARYTAPWDEDLLQHLFWDADISKNFDRLVKDKFNESWTGVLAVFLGTDSGLTRYCPAEAAELLEEERDTWRTPYYKRALDTDDFVFIASEDGKVDGNDTIVPDVTMVKAISVQTPNGKIYKPAVMGMKLAHSKVLNIMSEIKLKGFTCNDTESVVCYLLDDGGFVIATNQEDKYAQVGHFFGTVDNALMYALINDSQPPSARFYFSKIRYDYQASCADQPKKSSLAGLRSLRIPTLSMFYEFLSVNWWSSQITWAYVNFNIYNWLFGPSSSTVYAQSGDPPYTITDEEEEEEDAKDCSPVSEDAPSNHSCTKYEAQYYFDPAMEAAHSSVYCENCTREFAAARVKNTNLLLLIADPDCTNEKCTFYEILQAPKEDEEPDDCQIKMRYRQRPEGCYSKDDNEDDTKCGSFVHQPSSAFVILATIVTLLASWQLSQVIT